MVRSGIDSEIMLKLKDLDYRQCIAHTVKGSPCRGHISEGQLAFATSRLAKLHDLNDVEAATLEATIELLICANHRKNRTGVQIDALTHKYRSELLEFAKVQEIHDFTSPRAWEIGTRGSVKAKLGKVIKENECRTGSVYGYTWDAFPSLIKIGYAKNITSDRIKQWRKCYPGAVQVFEITFDFPHRMEELIHTQMASKRQELECNLKACPSTYHNEWFSCSVYEAERIARQWKEVSEMEPLYDLEHRKLTRYWQRLLQGFPTNLDVTAQSLLDLANKQPKAMDFVLDDRFARMSLHDSGHDC